MHVSNTEGLHSTVSSCRTAERESACSLFGTLDRLFFLLFRDLLLSDACTTHREKKRENEKETSREENVPEKSVNLITYTARVKFPYEI